MRGDVKPHWRGRWRSSARCRYRLLVVPARSRSARGRERWVSGSTPTRSASNACQLRCQALPPRRSPPRPSRRAARSGGAAWQVGQRRGARLGQDRNPAEAGSFCVAPRQTYGPEILGFKILVGELGRCGNRGARVWGRAYGLRRGGEIGKVCGGCRSWGSRWRRAYGSRGRADRPRVEAAIGMMKRRD